MESDIIRWIVVAKILELKEIQSNNIDKCILCGMKTKYFVGTPIDKRDCYIEGAGQLCQQCYYNLYINKNR